MTTNHKSGFLSIALSALAILSATSLPVSTQSPAGVPKNPTILVGQAPQSQTRNVALTRHVSVFRGPPGPSMPLGATLNPSANSTPSFDPLVLRYSATTTLVIHDLPPGARRKTQ